MIRLPPQDIDAEKSALGSVLIDPTYMDDVRDALASAEDFHRPANATIYHAMNSLLEHGKPLNAVTLTGKLQDMGALDQVGGVDYIMQLIEFVPGASAAGAYASRVADRALLRRLIERQETTLDILYSGDTPPSAIIDGSVNDLIEMRPRDYRDAAKLDYWLQESMEDDRPCISTGLYALDNVVEGFESSSYVIVGARPSMGKDQPLDALIRVGRGPGSGGAWRRMGDIEVGDVIDSIGGRESVVTGVFPQGVKQMYRIVLDDGKSVECGAGHLWRAATRQAGVPVTDRVEVDAVDRAPTTRVMTTLELAGEMSVAHALIPIDISKTQHVYMPVKSIEPSRITESQCISVSDPSRMYVTNDNILTHNTAFGVSVSLEMANAGVKAGFVSAEMSGKRVARRYVCAEANISTREFAREKHSPDIQGVIERQSELPLWVDQTPGAHIDQVCSRIRRWKREHDIQIAFVDYLQLLRTDRDNEYEGVTEASRKLNALKGELDITVVALAQLNRGNTMRIDKRPTMADLRGSGAVEQDADMILMLHREAYYADGQDVIAGKVKDDEAQILVEKNRDGATGVANVGWLGRCGVFTSGATETLVGMAAL